MARPRTSAALNPVATATSVAKAPPLLLELYLESNKAEMVQQGSELGVHPFAMP